MRKYEWIDINKEKPTEKKWILGAYSFIHEITGEKNLLVTDVFVDSYDEDGEILLLSKDGDFEYPITHWMELPPHPLLEKEENKLNASGAESRSADDANR